MARGIVTEARAGVGPPRRPGPDTKCTKTFVDNYEPARTLQSMATRKLPRPTDAELAILRVLWSRGPSTVREVHEALQDGSGYTTVLKLMQIMAEKGLVVRDESERAHVYSAKLTQERTQRQLVQDLVERAFGGSP